MTKVYLVRHAEAEGNAYRRIHGQYDSLLTEFGLQQVAALREWFADIPVDACFSSDQHRACKTAQAVYLAKGLPLIPDRRFREVHLGRWEDIPFGYLERFEKRDMDMFNYDDKNWHVDGSETWTEYTDRFLAGLNERCAQQEGKTIAIFAHACVLRGLQKRILKTDDLPFCENTSVTCLHWNDGEISFEFLNRASHLTPELSTPVRQQRLKQGATDRADFCLWFEKTADETESYFAKLRDKTIGRVAFGEGSAPHEGVIFDLSLDEPYRGRHFGQQLLGQAICTLRERGVKRLQTAVPEQNTGAMQFFRENGFLEQEHRENRTVLEKDIEVRKLP